MERSRTSLRKIEQFPKLFDYQRDLVDQICSVCLQSPPSNVGLLALPTGSGKTRTAAVALLKLLSTGGASTMLWLAPTRELLAQALAAVESAWMAYGTAVDVELVRADLLKAYPNDLDRGVVFSTPQMLSARLRRRDLPDSEIVVFDEAHHLPGAGFSRCAECPARATWAAVDRAVSYAWPEQRDRDGIAGRLLPRKAV